VTVDEANHHGREGSSLPSSATSRPAGINVAVVTDDGVDITRYKDFDDLL